MSELIRNKDTMINLCQNIFRIKRSVAVVLLAGIGLVGCGGSDSVKPASMALPQGNWGGDPGLNGLLVTANGAQLQNGGGCRLNAEDTVSQTIYIDSVGHFDVPGFFYDHAAHYTGTVKGSVMTLSVTAEACDNPLNVVLTLGQRTVEECPPPPV